MHKLILAFLICAMPSMAADVTGTWQMTVETNSGSGTPALELKQQGERLTGTLRSAIFGDLAVNGTVKGDRIEFWAEADAGGTTIKITYKGTIQSAAAMKGTAVYAGIDENATWSAARKSANQ
jgi:hypothetical protein